MKNILKDGLRLLLILLIFLFFQRKILKILSVNFVLTIFHMEHLKRFDEINKLCNAVFVSSYKLDDKYKNLFLENIMDV